MSRIMVGMSGGVDSSVAAALLAGEGHELIGVTLRLYDNGDAAAEKMCGSARDADDAAKIAAALGIPHKIAEFTDDFRDMVLSRFVSEYENGRTPNPCIVCNKYIKFGKMLDYALANDCDYVATGHYVKNGFDSVSGRHLLLRAGDEAKDQTYMLYMLSQQQLGHARFPLGDLKKTEVRSIAASLSLISADKPDSQDICFVPDGRYAEFIEKYRGAESAEGDFVDSEGNCVGRHGGIIRYTIGQRKGLGIAFGKPMFVIKKDSGKNTVTLGEEELLFSRRVRISDINLIALEKLESPLQVEAKIRYNQKVQPALLIPDENGAVLEFDSPQRAATPGQAAVFYDGAVTVGGGVIV